MGEDGLTTSVHRHGKPRSPGHGHLWHLQDGTSLHAPPGKLVVDEGTGQLCCHLCGRWFRSLGSHVRAHGYTADSYRLEMGLMRSRALVAADLSDAISRTQSRRYEQSPQLQSSFAEGQALARSGELARIARTSGAHDDERLERVNGRRRDLARGRANTTDAREAALALRLASLNVANLTEYVLESYTANATIDAMSSATGVARIRIRQVMADAGLTPRPIGWNSPAGRRARVESTERAAAARVGTTDADLVSWLQRRRLQGWTLTQLGEAVGHSSHWVRWRLDAASDGADQTSAAGYQTTG